MRSLLLLPMLALAACTVPKILGDNPNDDETDGDSGTLGVSSGAATAHEDPGSSGPAVTTGLVTTPNDPSEPSDDTLGPGTTGGATDSDGPTMVCPTRAGFECSFPTDCDEQSCGALGSAFDAAGCPRTPCNDAPCGEGEVCYVPDEWGFEGCRSTLSGSVNGDGACNYIYDDDCGGRYCVPADEGPPANCPALTDEASCLAAGCSQFTMVRPVIGNQEDVCSCGALQPACLWFPPEPHGGEDGPGVFYNAKGEVMAFSIAWADTKPHGWFKCFGDPAEPQACQHCREFGVDNCL